MKRKRIIQNVLLQLLAIWGIASILVCAEEDIPGQPMGDALFFDSKTIGIVSFGLCLLTGRYLKGKGLLPDVEKEGNETED